MRIDKHLLLRDDGSPYSFVRSPNISKGDLKPRFLVMHYTAGGSAKESINWLANPAAKASAHVVIGRDGTVTQMVPFNRVAWHAGASKWRGIDGLNRHSIGIELDNPGRLTRGADGKWRAYFGTVYPEDQVMVATHKNEQSPSGWARYPQVQLDVALAMAKELVRTYGLEEVVGHEDISPGRKQDPGPAFPMREFAAAAMGKLPEAAPTPVTPGPSPVVVGAPTHATTTVLKIRGGPGGTFGEVSGSPLPQGTPLVVIATQGEWRQVVVPGPVRGQTELHGWVHGGYLRAVAPQIRVLGPTWVPA